jgi:hypothetical protein
LGQSNRQGSQWYNNGFKSNLASWANGDMNVLCWSKNCIDKNKIVEIILAVKKN